MSLSGRFYQVYYEAKGNKWFHYFAVFCRIMLALAFIIAGLVKIRGERFASGLSVNNPMGHYLEALYHTGYYYTFIGAAQLLIAILSFKQVKEHGPSAREKQLSNKFPFLFFGSVVAILAAVVFLNNIIYDIRPGNSPEECTNGCPDNSDPKACENSTLIWVTYTT